jgi:16S rRNA processing protein RimM
MIRVGKIVATHGLGGDVIVTHVTGRKNWLKAGDVLFVAIRKDSYIPHFVERIKSASEDEVVLHFEDTEAVEAARRLVGKDCFLEEAVLAKTGSDSPLLWIGFEAVDRKLGSLGPIIDIYQTAQQWLATVTYKGNEALLPLIEQTLRGVDLKKRQVQLELPEGLMDIYA